MGLLKKYRTANSPPAEGWQAQPDGVVFSYPTNLRKLVGVDLYDALLKIKSFYAFFISFLSPCLHRYLSHSLANIIRVKWPLICDDTKNNTGEFMGAGDDNLLFA